MKKIVLAFAAIAALSTGALAAGNHSWDLRESPTYYGKYAENNKGAAGPSVTTNSAALAFGNGGGAMSAFDRMTRISIENSEHGRH